MSMTTALVIAFSVLLLCSGAHAAARRLGTIDSFVLIMAQFEESGVLLRHASFDILYGNQSFGDKLINHAYCKLFDYVSMLRSMCLFELVGMVAVVARRKILGAVPWVLVLDDPNSLFMTDDPQSLDSLKVERLVIFEFESFLRSASSRFVRDLSAGGSFPASTKSALSGFNGSTGLAVLR
ncbi:hypothetical protein FNV43_RR04630 [Rhamnella rubrinervis]|uniref:Uncharacterized protein n=1 Tax=Rhamnella rubrinervis TaxID=2594499 RepID=A0A8K0HMB2_9ROSA|nr:hypothetical protein FNV43_RR04630 [Rhamnella rubrinervis]